MTGSEWMNYLISALVSAGVNGVWAGCILAVMASAILRLLPRSNAATRHGIWLTTLLLVIATPFALLIPRPAMAGAQAAAVPQAALTVPVTVSWPGYVALGWLLVSAVMLARVAWSLWHIRQLKRNATLIARRENIPVLASGSVRVPMAAGFIRRAVIFPQALLAELGTAEFEQVLAHEMAHLRRADDWVRLCEEIARALFFFNPAIHFIGRRLAIEREMACDDRVVANTGQARPYAACLTHLHELTRRRGSLGAAAQLAPGVSTGKRRQITARVEALLDPAHNLAPRLTRSGWAAAAALAGMAFFVAVRATPPVGAQPLPVAALAIAQPGGPAAPAISRAPRLTAAVPRPHVLARAMGPRLPRSLAIQDKPYVLVNAWQLDVTPTYFVIAVVYYQPPPPTTFNGI